MVDLALIARTQAIDGPALRAAILVGTGHRGLPLPTAFTVPDWEAWKAGFIKTMAVAPGEPMTFVAAYELVKRFLDPVLDGPVPGQWDPQSSRWAP